MSEAMLITPLYDRTAPDGLSISMTEIVDRGMIDLRGHIEDKKFMAAVESVLGFSLPTRPRTSESKGEITCLWMSIDQWLIVCPRKQAADLQEKLKVQLGDIFSFAVDLSDARTILRLEGENVRETLMKGSSIDFTQPEYTAGCVRRMMFAEIAAMVHIVSDDPNVFDLMMFRSYAHHVWDWVEATAKVGSEVGFLSPQSTPNTI